MSTNLSYLMPVNPRGFFSNVTRRGHKLPPLEKLPFEWGRWDVFKREQEVCDTDEDGNPEYSESWCEIDYESHEEAEREAQYILSDGLAGDNYKVSHSTYTVERVPSVAMPGGQTRPSVGDLPLVKVSRETHSQYSDECHPSDRERQVGYYVTASEARAWLWKKYGINLAALSAYEQCMGPSLISDKSKAEALSRAFGIKTSATKTDDKNTFHPVTSTYAPPGGTEGLNLEDIETTLYYALDDVATIAAHMDCQLFDFLAGRGGTPPPCAISFSPDEQGDERASVVYFDGPDLDPVGQPLPFAGLKGAPASKLLQLIRVRAEYRYVGEQLRDMAFNEVRIRNPELFEHLGGGDTRTDEKPLDKARLLEERNRLNEAQEKYIKEARELYITLAKVADKRKEENLSDARKLKTYDVQIAKQSEILGTERDAYTKMANNIREALPHMSVLPAGIDSVIHRANEGPMAEALIRVSRHVQGQKGPSQLELSLAQEDSGLPDLMKAANAFFGHLKLNWLFPVGYVGLCRLFEEANGYNSINSDVDTSSSGFWCTIRPGASDRIKDKGLEDWWRRHHKDEKEVPKAADLFLLMMAFLSRINLPFEKKDSAGKVSRSTIYGLTQVSAVSEGARGQKTAHWRFNPQLAEFITGDQPMFMVVNHHAMFSYGGKMLHTAPALQLYLEDMARTNVYKGLYKKNSGTLLTPSGDGYTFGKIAERLGLPNNASPSHNMRRIIQALETVQDTGVIKNFRQQGRTRTNAYETKLEITMSNTYEAAYELAKMKREKDALERKLRKPFAPPKRGGKALTED